MQNTEWQNRTQLLLGTPALQTLANAHVMVLGLGGVGAYAAEMLCRAGVGQLTIIDADTVDITNLNRQLPALHSTIGKNKTDVLKDRFLDINPQLKLNIFTEFLKDERIACLLDLTHYDYLVDAIDSLAPKVFFLAEAVKRNIPVVSAMGAGAKIDPSQIQVADISKTHQCHLAAAVRKRLRKMGISKGIKTVFSTEIAPETAIIEKTDILQNKTSVVGTISYLPAMFGCYCASVCIRDLIKE